MKRILVLILLCFQNASLGQEDERKDLVFSGHHVAPEASGWVETTTVDSKGVRHTHLVPIPGTIADQQSKRHAAMVTSSDMRVSGLSELLNSLTIKDLEFFCRPELLRKQYSDLSDAVKNYHSEIKKSEDIFQRPRIRRDALQQISEILLPEQKVSLGKKFGGTRVVTPLLTEEKSNLLELTDNQRQKLIQRSKIANENIKEAIEEQNRILQQCRNEVSQIFQEVLTKEQRRKLKVEHVIKSMNLEDLDFDTEFDIP